MQSRFTSFLFSMLFIGVSMFGGGKKPFIYEAMPYEILVHGITNTFTQQMQTQFNLYCMGGGGAMSRDVEEVALAFIAYRRGTIDEGRKIMVQLIDNLQMRLNDKSELHPYLREYPFPPDRVRIRLSYRKENDQCYADGSPVLIFQRGGYLYYCAEDPKTERLVDIMNEEYSKAKEIVERGNSGLAF